MQLQGFFSRWFSALGVRRSLAKASGPLPGFAAAESLARGCLGRTSEPSEPIRQSTADLAVRWWEVEERAGGLQSSTEIVRMMACGFCGTQAAIDHERTVSQSWRQRSLSAVLPPPFVRALMARAYKRSNNNFDATSGR
jgi:hypothetical protein